jgi:hypothetical protein
MIHRSGSFLAIISQAVIINRPLFLGYLKMLTREEVLKQALELSPEDWEILQIQLLESLRTPYQKAGGCYATPELAAKWSAEIDRRIEAYLCGEAKAEDAHVVMKRMREYVDAYK